MTNSAASNNVVPIGPEEPVTRDNVTDWNGTEATAYNVTPCKGDVSSKIVDEVENLIKAYVFCSERDRTLMTLWSFHANVFGWFRFTPRLGFTAGTENCGKSQALKVCRFLTNNSFFQADASSASFFTLTQQGDKAVFVDEMPDLLGGDRTNLVTALKTGCEEGGVATRIELHNGRRRPMIFSTHSAVAFSGVGVDGMFDRQLYSRTLWIHMQPAYRAEQPEPFYQNDSEPNFREVTSKMLKWLHENETKIKGFDRSNMPDYLYNRDRDKWEPLYAIASVAGEKWLERVRDISLEVKDDEVLTDETKLLKAIQDIYHDWNEYSRGAERDTKTTPAELCRLLCMWEDEDGWRPYANFNKVYHEEDKTIKSEQLTKRLRSFKLKTEGHRSSIDKDRTRGYLWKDLLDTADRHLPEDFRHHGEDVSEDEISHSVTRDKVEEEYDDIPF
jgi:hypothetical protein|tara:strand:- start:370 stop:1704 length:1335 start_codon:yes stop_codon:yes gene_type:complete